MELESNTITKIKDFFYKKVILKIDHKIFVYLVFVAISTVFWFLYEFSNDYTTTINYPVRFTNLPKNKVLVNDLPKKLMLNVNAYGFTLLRYKLSPASFPIIINMEEYGNTIGNPNAKQFKLLTRYTRETISKQMPNDIEVLDILPDTVFFQFANIVSKKVPIKPNVKLEFEEQCMLNGAITFTPDSILVKGPNTILDTLKGIYCKFQKFDGLEKTLQRNVALVEIKTLEYDKKRTIIQLPVSKFTEASFEVPIQARNVPDTLDLKTFPRMTKVSFLIALDDYNKIQTKDFVAVVDYADIANLLGSKLSLKLELTPKNVQSIRYFPESVEFILDKK